MKNIRIYKLEIRLSRVNSQELTTQKENPAVDDKKTKMIERHRILIGFSSY